MLVVVPSDWVTCWFHTKFVWCFPSCCDWTEFQRKVQGIPASCGIWMHGAGVVAIHIGNLAYWVESFRELWARENLLYVPTGAQHSVAWCPPFLFSCNTKVSEHCITWTSFSPCEQGMRVCKWTEMAHKMTRSLPTARCSRTRPVLSFITF